MSMVDFLMPDEAESAARAWVHSGPGAVRNGRRFYIKGGI